MPLFQLAGVENFCFNLLLQFLSIVCILSSQAILFQIFLHALFPQFPLSTLLPFTNYFKLHNLMYLEVDVLIDDMTIPLQTALNYIFDLYNKTHPIHKNISRSHSINQSHLTHHTDHTMLHPMQPQLIHKSKFPCFATVQQNWSNTTLIIFPCCFKGKPYLPTNKTLNSLNYFHALPILALTASGAPP